eukprot:3501066-Pleurochrysis_carterae.AAC.1
MPGCRMCSASFLLESEFLQRWLWLARQALPCPSLRSPRGVLPRSTAPWECEEVDSVLPRREWQRRSEVRERT